MTDRPWRECLRWVQFAFAQGGVVGTAVFSVVIAVLSYWASCVLVRAAAHTGAVQPPSPRRCRYLVAYAPLRAAAGDGGGGGGLHRGAMVRDAR